MDRNDAQIPNRDGSSQPTAETPNNRNPETRSSNSSSDPQDKSPTSPTSPPHPSLSEARRRANAANAKKSTGPKTARGKRHSSFNSLRHGLLAKKIMFSPDGKLQEEGLLELLENLRNKYGHADVRTELLLENIVVDYWRQRRALELEVACLEQPQWTFCPQGTMPTVHRYQTASQRAMLKNLERLDELQSPASEADEDETAEETPNPPLENPFARTGARQRFDSGVDRTGSV
jgi:hypothetical protein